MKRTTKSWTKLAAGFVLTGLAAANTQAQSADALINKLVDKGILTAKEAKDLRQEVDRDFTKAYQTKTGMPDWVTSLKFSGDFRGRFEGFYADSPVFPDRNRLRYRLRVGTVATLKDNFEVGFRLSGSDLKNGTTTTLGQGGDPISPNTTAQDNASRKFVFIDLAYGKWTPVKTATLTGSFAVGKVENPFVTSDSVFDPDYNPEGVSSQWAYKVNDQHTVKLNLGGFVVDEVSTSSHDPYLVGAQIRWDATWNKKIATTLGFGMYGLMGDQNLPNTAIPDLNIGNTRFGVGGAGAVNTPVNNYNPWVVDAAITYTLDSFPGYKGAFPIKLAGEYMENPAAPVMNKAYNASITFGKSGKKGLWDISYKWKYLGSDAWFEEFTDSDWGALWVRGPGATDIPPGAGLTTAPGSLVAGAYAAGTNVRGHLIKASYSLSDSMSLNVTWFQTELINKYSSTLKTDMSRLQVDALWKF